jgi:hypothetical protein
VAPRKLGATTQIKCNPAFSVAIGPVRLLRKISCPRRDAFKITLIVEGVAGGGFHSEFPLLLSRFQDLRLAEEIDFRQVDNLIPTPAEDCSESE